MNALAGEVRNEPTPLQATTGCADEAIERVGHAIGRMRDHLKPVLQPESEREVNQSPHELVAPPAGPLIYDMQRHVVLLNDYADQLNEIIDRLDV